MAVLASKRKTSKSEYENSFKNLYRLTEKNFEKVSKRKHKFICDNFMERMNAIFDDILSIAEDYYYNDDTAKVETEKRIKRAMARLMSLEKQLFVFWNIENYETRKMEYWANLVDKEVALLNDMLEGDDVVVDMKSTMILDWKKIKNTPFLSKMSQLHKVVHSKAEHIPNKYLKADTYLLIKNIDDAWYNLLKANERIPKTHKQYETRRKLMSDTISSLNKLQRQLVTFFNIMDYSNNTMKEISGMLTDELKMLYKIQKSDKERFSGLK